MELHGNGCQDWEHCVSASLLTLCATQSSDYRVDRMLALPLDGSTTLMHGLSLSLKLIMPVSLIRVKISYVCEARKQWISHHYSIDWFLH